MAGRAWIKLYERWLTCPRHAGLSGDVLGTGALLLLVAESMGVEGEAGARWLLGPTGAPVTLASCHRHVRVRSASCRSRVGQLLAVGTMVEREDGCLGFSKYRQWQENPAAERVRKHRESRNKDVTSNVTGNREAEAEAEAEALITAPKNGAKKRARRRVISSEIEDDIPGLVDAVLVAMREAVKAVTRGRDRGPQNTPGNRDLIRRCTRREQASLESWKCVIAAQAASVRARPEAWRYLALSTISVRRNWLRLLDAPASMDLRGPVDPSTQDHEKETPF